MDPGDVVLDRADDDPNPAIVVRVPDLTIADWTYERDGDTVSTADANPDYPRDAQLVNVTFKAQLDEGWPAWIDAPPEELWPGVQDHDLPVYGFPEGRLAYRDPPAALAPVIDRLEGNVDTLDWRPADQHLYVEKLGDSYTITPDRTVTGDGLYADELAAIVSDTADGPSHKYQP